MRARLRLITLRLCWNQPTRHCERSEAIQENVGRPMSAGLLRRCASRNDGDGSTLSHYALELPAPACERTGSSLAEPLRPPPVAQQRAPRFRRALIEDRDLRHAVEAEMAERRARLAPSGEHARIVKEANRDRPDDPGRSAALLVRIGEGQLAFFAKRVAHDRERRKLRLPRFPRAGEQRRPVERLGAVGRQNGGDLGERAQRRLLEALVGAALDPARAERQRLDLLEAEHQGRQCEAGLELIAEPRLPLYPRALRLERFDVAVERAQRNAKLFGERAACDRAAAEAKALHELEQPFGARHRFLAASYGALTHRSTGKMHSRPSGSAPPSIAA